MGTPKPPSIHSTLAGCLEGGERERERGDREKVLILWGVWDRVGV